MLSAEEAKIYTMHSIQTRNKHIYDLVSNEIEASIKKGEYQTHIYRSIPNEIRELLISKKYRLETQFDRNDEYTTIYWS
jgi:hypothetical protein